MTNLTNPKKPGGYQNLIIYQQAVIIFDLTVLFCKTYLTHKSNWTHWTNNPESFCNLLITLINKENYLLDKMLKVLEEKFISEGGYSENLFKRRLAFREGKLDK